MTSNSIKDCLICKEHVSTTHNSQGSHARWLLDCIGGELFHFSNENQAQNPSEEKVSLLCMDCIDRAKQWRSLKNNAKTLLGQSQEVKSTVISLILQSRFTDRESDNSSNLPENIRKICQDFTKLREEIIQGYVVDQGSNVQQEVLSQLPAEHGHLNAHSDSNRPKSGREGQTRRKRPHGNQKKTPTGKDGAAMEIGEENQLHKRRRLPSPEQTVDNSGYSDNDPNTVNIKHSNPSQHPQEEYSVNSGECPSDEESLAASNSEQGPSNCNKRSKQPVKRPTAGLVPMSEKTESSGRSRRRTKIQQETVESNVQTPRRSIRKRKKTTVQNEDDSTFAEIQKVLKLLTRLFGRLNESRNSKKQAQ